MKDNLVAKIDTANNATFNIMESIRKIVGSFKVEMNYGYSGSAKMPMRTTQSMGFTPSEDEATHSFC